MQSSSPSPCDSALHQHPGHRPHGTVRCGRIYMQGSLIAVNDNGIPTAVRQINGDVKGVCVDRQLWKPQPVPPALFGVASLRPWVLPAASRLVFLMGTHARLGRSAMLSHLDPLVLRLVLQFANMLAPPALRP